VRVIHEPVPASALFDAVAREGSFTRAAERLFISQPAVTGHIKALEEHYQISLLRRTARRVELTEEGTKLAAITGAMFGLAEEAQTMLEANRQLLTGRLEVAADGPHMVMPMLASPACSISGDYGDSAAGQCAGNPRCFVVRACGCGRC
jgi:DNA-binding transcriptional LysR family regulator